MTSDPSGVVFEALDLTIACADGFVIVVVVVVVVAVVAVVVGGEADSVGGVEVVTEVAFDEVLFVGAEFSSLFEQWIVEAFVFSSVASHDDVVCGVCLFIIVCLFVSLFV